MMARESGEPGPLKAEVAVLRSRINEQSQLICALKRRADQSTGRCQALEAVNEERETLRHAAEVAREAEVRRARQLEERFDDLANNHQMMIRFKDEYKQQNAELREECSRLRRNMEGESSREREEMFHRLQQESKERARALREVDNLFGQLKDVSEDRDAVLREREERIGKLEEELRRLSTEGEKQRARIGELEQQQRRAEERRREETEELGGQLERLSREKDELLDLSMSRGRLIQERQQQVVLLQDELRAVIEERRREEQQAGEGGAMVLVLQRRLREAEQTQARLQREFNAYKQHSAELLAKERALNAKLRHVIS
uniref:Coiled-coil domain-containing protein 89 n=1 Tax=Geotrypetes seraphini TaxID=260995 RepID=A0A6P8Q500_GEOSA|nr:coiled-coil domain-containing protein 89 [Geotrypetes seraphini]